MRLESIAAATNALRREMRYGGVAMTEGCTIDWDTSLVARSTYRQQFRASASFHPHAYYLIL